MDIIETINLICSTPKTMIYDFCGFARINHKRGLECFAWGLGIQV